MNDITQRDTGDECECLNCLTERVSIPLATIEIAGEVYSVVIVNKYPEGMTQRDLEKEFASTIYEDD